MNLLETVRDALRTKHYAYRTEKTYLHWIRKYAYWLKPTHPREAGADGVKRFLTHLAVERQVSATTQYSKPSIGGFVVFVQTLWRGFREFRNRQSKEICLLADRVDA